MQILLKIAKKNHDNLILKRNALQESIDSLSYQIEKLEIKIENEIKTFFNSEFSSFLEAYIKNANLQKDIMNVNLQDLNEKINVINEEIKESFSEIKRYEIIIQNAKIKEIKRLKDKETKELDEVNTIIFNRKKENTS